MKKSECFKEAQRCVLHSDLSDDIKLFIIRELIELEDVARFAERREEDAKAVE